MAFERTRLLASGALWLAAGAIAAAAAGSSRAWVGVCILVIAGTGVGWPLTRLQRVTAVPHTPTLPPDEKRLLILQAQLEHLPVATWLQVDDQIPKALSSRARRLAAPGGVRDLDSLLDVLKNGASGGAVLLDTERGSERWQLSRQPISLDGQSQTLIVLVPLEHALESESLRSWEQLTQVLTHEIMNSLTPIKSLSETALSLLNDPGGEPELRIALEAIGRRAESLSSFVTTYRRVTRWPPPELAPVDLQQLFNSLKQAVGATWAARGGEASFELSSRTLRLMADEGQLEQALLALFHNAEQATHAHSAPRLWVQARQGRGGRLQITVRDNGPGVAPGLERQIFLPFFSAREGGQGIGLTVVRQLVSGMGGRVRYVRPLEGGAAFVLSF